MKAKGSLIKQEAEIEASKEEVESFFQGIVPDFVKEAGGIVTDQVRFWRFRNQVRIVKNAEKIIEENGLSKQHTPLKVLAPLLEQSSYEEDESLQQKWANLLANAVTGRVNVTSSYVQILSELQPLEVVLLDLLFQSASKESDYEKRKKMQYGKDKVCEVLGLGSEQFDLIIENLFRLGLCQPPGSSGITFGESRVALQTTSVFELTTFGYQFVSACKI